MTTLAEQLSATLEGVKQQLPDDILTTMGNDTEALKASGIEGKTIQDNETAPDFTLPNHLGENKNLRTMLQEGPLVVSFYRGGW